MIVYGAFSTPVEHFIIINVESLNFSIVFLRLTRQEKILASNISYLDIKFLFYVRIILK